MTDSVDRDKCLLLYLHHYGTIQSSLKTILCSLPVHPSHPPDLWQPLMSSVLIYFDWNVSKKGFLCVAMAVLELAQ